MRALSDLDAVLARSSQELPGLRSPERRAQFIHELRHSMRGIAWLRELRPNEDRVEPDSATWNPLHAIALLTRDGDVEEATWLSVLTTHFGRDDRGEEPWRSARLVYGGFGSRRLTWPEVSRDATLVGRLCAENNDVYRTLRFGNHRKREYYAPTSPRGVGAVVESYARGIEARAGGRQSRLFTGADRSPEERFNRLFHTLAFIVRFGRTALFDLLTLLGNLHVYELEPPSIYLVGATGPRRGAEVILGRPVRTRRERDEADGRLSELARELSVPVQAMEDALCNWQKHL